MSKKYLLLFGLVCFAIVGVLHSYETWFGTQGQNEVVEVARPLPQVVSTPAKSVVLAVFDGGRKVVTFNAEFELVCVENSDTGILNVGQISNLNSAAFSCWNTSELSPQFRGLVKKHREMKHVPF